MKNSILYIPLFVLFLGLASCKNDLDVLAPGTESVSVYGLINPNEGTQNIRINKVYLTDGDALAAGKDGSNINFGPGELTVTLERYMTGSTTPVVTTVGSTKKQIVLTETVVTTQSGNFNENQRIWQTTDKLYNTGEYKLTIRKNGTELEYTAQNLVVDSVKPNNNMPFKFYQNPNPDQAYPMHGSYITVGAPGTVTNARAYIDYSSRTNVQKIRFTSIPNAKLYNVVMRFHYIDSLLGNSVTYNYADFNFPNLTASTLNGNEPLEVNFVGDEFYTNLKNVISAKNVSNLKNRKVDYMEYIISAGAESLSDFLQVNAPSTTIAQDKPYYTNIKGGVGIFSARSRATVTKDLIGGFIDKIACHPSTISLMFCNSSGVPATGVCP